MPLAKSYSLHEIGKHVGSPTVPDRQRDDDETWVAHRRHFPQVTEDVRDLLLDVQFLEKHTKQSSRPFGCRR